MELDTRKDAEALGVPFVQTPAVLLDGQVVLSGLPRTEEIEAWLRQSAIVKSRDNASSKNP